MKKKILGIAIAIVMLFAVAGLAACELNNHTLAEYQAAARVDLTNYAQSRGQTNFTTENWAVIQDYVATGKAAIDAAETKPAVRIARDNAKAAIRGVDNVTCDDCGEKSCILVIEDFKLTITEHPNAEENLVGGTFIITARLENLSARNAYILVFLHPMTTNWSSLGGYFDSPTLMRNEEGSYLYLYAEAMICDERTVGNNNLSAMVSILLKNCQTFDDTWDISHTDTITIISNEVVITLN